ncbi:ABC transporter ATP-binding protein [Chitinivibrio alkaliphilus]|uniref:ABC-type dipeptide/oligopeptide/nickel transport system, ATPase component n=1 Tax=Chitinivibrio alkaliphilus ACht1 TaxID=1313304 RepID=U7DCK1_9BACT|nr:ABC transporter ATP-binding protein [Chitinivibrio alkaliphilus]ERP32170.1 ABC-type dipeptide/oligopeptide/nickel transport system, ATPase component [Chitinivibrio alkaliphilus ACht1]
MAVFEVKNLSLHYRTRFGKRIHAVQDVSFSMEEGEILGIAGESGCGKTTLVSGCMGLFIPPLYPTSGDVLVRGESLMGRSPDEVRENVLSKKVSMIPQGAFNALNPTRKIKDLAADLIMSHEKDTVSRKDLYPRIRERFSILGMDTDKVLNSFPIQLTAGEKQRSVIGISTLLNPGMVIADEPTSALDVSTQKKIIGMIFDLLDKKIFSTMMFITHELNLLRHVADRIAIMYAGQIVELGTTEQIVFDGRHPYTQALMGSIMSVDENEKDKKPESLEGAPPNLANPIEGCRFAPRCKVAREDCKHTEQVIRMVGDREVRCKYAE